MNVLELYELALWFRSYFGHLNKRYSELHSVLKQNASQPEQQPLEEQLTNLNRFLCGMSIAHLSIQQLELLEQLNVSQWIGQAGAAKVDSTVKTASYDPASTRDKITKAMETIQSANQHLNSYFEAVTSLGLVPTTSEPDQLNFFVRIGFKKEATIHSFSELKTNAEDWFLIAQGVARAADENPEDIRILGATQGSIILILATSACVTGIFALISRHLTGIAKDVISVGRERERLRQENLITKVMEKEFDKLEERARENGIAAIKAELSNQKSDDNAGDDLVALDKAIDKLVTFAERGGDIDFVAPPEIEADEAEAEPTEEIKAVLESVRRVRQLIYDCQEQREAVRMLESGSDTGTDE